MAFSSASPTPPSLSRNYITPFHSFSLFSIPWKSAQQNPHQRSYRICTLNTHHSHINYGRKPTSWNNGKHLRLRPDSAFGNGEAESSGEEEEEEEDFMGSDFEMEKGRGTIMDGLVAKLKKVGHRENPVRGNTVRDESLPRRGGFYTKESFGFDNCGGDDDDEEEEEEEEEGVQFPWEKRSEEVLQEKSLEKRSRSRTAIAELTLPPSELRRLRYLAVRTKGKVKIGGAGVTREIVGAIQEKWKTCEVIRIRCEGPPALNMKKMHEILEKRTGGLVIWRTGGSVSLYRGVDYDLPSKSSDRQHRRQTRFIDLNDDNNGPIGGTNNSHTQQFDIEPSTAIKDDNPQITPQENSYEEEINELLDSLGPRFTDWPGGDPLPVDADLLPSVVAGYKPPFRHLPYGVRPTIGGRDLTHLRRLGNALPPHFALGRSRQHHGLAMAMLKLWERSSIAKIALKRGVDNSCSERMAEEIKSLTGGMLLSRNKDSIVFHRGKDFLSPDVTEALLERERLARTLQDQEEIARVRASSSVIMEAVTCEELHATGTLGETLEANVRWGKELNNEGEKLVARAAEAAKHAVLVRKLERKLASAQYKVMKAEKALAKVEEFLKPSEVSADPGCITDEERFMFRKLGLKMKAFLLLGRRGVFDGTVENMHLHWKYRELIKIILKAKSFEQVKNVALSLEAESGGVLVSVDKISKGYAIIVFRGKDYKRPPLLRPKNLLTKRKALARSIELQRREALHKHINLLGQQVESLRAELKEMEIMREPGDSEFYSKMDSAYPSDDEESEDEGDEAYLETFNAMDKDFPGSLLGGHDDDYDDLYSPMDHDQQPSEREIQGKETLLHG